MAFLTLHEMLPIAFDYAGHKQAVQALFLGMAFMSVRLVIIIKLFMTLLCIRRLCSLTHHLVVNA